MPVYETKHILKSDAHPGGISAQELIKDLAREDKVYEFTRMNKTKGKRIKGIYLIQIVGGCNSALVKIGMSDDFVNRLKKYVTYFVETDKVKILSFVQFHNVKGDDLVYFFEQWCLRNLLVNQKRIRTTEWFLKKDMGLEYALWLLENVCDTLFTQNIGFFWHVFSRTPFNRRLFPDGYRYISILNYLNEKDKEIVEYAKAKIISSDEVATSLTMIGGPVEDDDEKGLTHEIRKKISPEALETRAKKSARKALT